MLMYVFRWMGNLRLAQGDLLNAALQYNLLLKYRQTHQYDLNIHENSSTSINVNIYQENNYFDSVHVIRQLRNDSDHVILNKKDHSEIKKAGKNPQNSKNNDEKSNNYGYGNREERGLSLNLPGNVFSKHTVYLGSPNNL